MLAGASHRRHWRSHHACSSSACAHDPGMSRNDGSNTDGVVTHRQRRGWASGNQSCDWCGQRYSWTTSRLRSRTSRHGSGVNTVGRSVGTTRRAGHVQATIGVLGHESGEIQGDGGGQREQEPWVATDNEDRVLTLLSLAALTPFARNSVLW